MEVSVGTFLSVPEMTWTSFAIVLLDTEDPDAKLKVSYFMLACFLCSFFIHVYYAINWCAATVSDAAWPPHVSTYNVGLMFFFAIREVNRYKQCRCICELVCPFRSVPCFKDFFLGIVVQKEPSYEFHVGTQYTNTSVGSGNSSATVVHLKVIRRRWADGLIWEREWTILWAYLVCYWWRHYLRLNFRNFSLLSRCKTTQSMITTAWHNHVIFVSICSNDT